MQAVREGVRQEMTNNLKKLKKHLTNLRGYGIISNTSDFWKAAEKKFQKTFPKPLDKVDKMWYNTEAVHARACE